jgi:threonine dehydrogenase-like Zn-dependent dehydrogenase
MNIFRRSEVRSGDTVGIIGIGFLGSLLTRLCADAGARVIAMARKPSALRVAERMGAHERIALEENWQAVEQVRGLTDGRLCDIVMECVGKQGPLELAGELAKERGRLVIAGYHQDGLRQVNLQLWNWRGLDVINAHEREQRVYIEGIREAVEAVSSGRVNPDPLYTHRFPLHRLDEALNLTKERPDGFMKALVMVEGQA